MRNEGSEEDIVKDFHQHSEPDSNTTYVVPHHATDRSENLVRKSIWLDSKVHEKRERIELMGLVIKVARNRGWVNGTDVDASRSQLDRNIGCERTYVRFGGTIQRTKRRWLASSRRRSENDAASQIFRKHSGYKKMCYLHRRCCIALMIHHQLCKRPAQVGGISLS